MLKPLLSLAALLLAAHTLVAEDWTSKDKAFAFTLPEKWTLEAQEDKKVEAQFRSPENARGINVSVSPIPANFHLSKKSVTDGITKQGGTLLAFDDKTVAGQSAVRYSFDLPGTGQFSVVFLFTADHAYKWQAFTTGKLTDVSVIGAAAKTVHLIK